MCGLFLLALTALSNEMGPLFRNNGDLTFTYTTETAGSYLSSSDAPSPYRTGRGLRRRHGLGSLAGRDTADRLASGT